MNAIIPPSAASREEILAYMAEQDRLRARGLIKAKARRKHALQMSSKVR